MGMRSFGARVSIVGALLIPIAGSGLAQSSPPDVPGAQAPAAANPGSAGSSGSGNGGSDSPSAGATCDPACVVANMDRAGPACARAIEATAPIDFDWLNRPFTGLFQEADPMGNASPVVIYRGDSIRFLSARGQWVRQTYECAFDVRAGAVGPVRTWAGRIGQAPAAVAAVETKKPSAPAAGNVAGGGSGKVDGKALAAAISQAVRNKSQPAARAPTPMKIKPGEVSPVEVEQVDTESLR